MAENKPEITLKITRKADLDLKEIYLYNLQARGLDQANIYLGFLTKALQDLLVDQAGAKPVHGFPGTKSKLVRKSIKGDGHIVIFEVIDSKNRLDILHIFHSKMDYLARLRAERDSGD